MKPLLRVGLTKSIVRLILRYIGVNILRRKIRDKRNAQITQPITLWFDDGYIEDFTIAYPLLKRYNIQGVSAITTGFIGKTGCLNVQQLKTMMRNGWKIASHTVTHPKLTSLSMEQLDWEMRESKRWIRKNLNVEPLCLVAPYNAIGSRELKHAQLYYDFVATERKLVFHSKHFNKNWTPKLVDFKVDAIYPSIAKTERTILGRLISNIESSHRET